VAGAFGQDRTPSMVLFTTATGHQATARQTEILELGPSSLMIGADGECWPCLASTDGRVEERNRACSRAGPDELGSRGSHLTGPFAKAGLSLCSRRMNAGRTRFGGTRVPPKIH
jgi:hypothetical protein